MLFFKKRKVWKDVFMSTDMTQFFRAKNLLSEHGIQFKDSTGGMHNALSGGHSARGSMGAGRDLFIKTIYILSVSEQDEGKARMLLGRMDEDK